jgi:hypothetical protein
MGILFQLQIQMFNNQVNSSNSNFHLVKKIDYRSPTSKITVKGATQLNGHSVNLHFCMFERSQGKHNSLNCYILLE